MMHEDRKKKERARWFRESHAKALRCTAARPARDCPPPPSPPMNRGDGGFLLHILPLFLSEVFCPLSLERWKSKAKLGEETRAPWWQGLWWGDSLVASLERDNSTSSTGLENSRMILNVSGQVREALSREEKKKTRVFTFPQKKVF